MTVSSITPVNNYAGDGSNKTFDFDFPIENKNELTVTKINSDGTRVVLTCDLDYTIDVITDNDDNFVSFGQNITFPISSSSHSILGNDEKISLALSLSIEQQKEMGNSNKLNLSTLEWCLDYLTRLIQILNRKTERALKVQEGSGITTDILAVNLNKVADNSSDISSVASNISVISAVNNNLSNINTVAGDKPNIDAIASDLANIDNASAYASLASDWANKTTGTVDGVEYSAKYYAERASEGQVQADWLQSDNTKKDYIKNKPASLSDFVDDLGTSPTHSHSQYLTSHQDISGKADVDLTNCTKPHITETYVNGTSWYRVYSDGWCEQGGNSTNWSNGTSKSVSLLKTFANTNYAVFLQQSGARGNNGESNTAITSKTTTEFNASTGVINTCSLDWLACGYIN